MKIKYSIIIPTKNEEEAIAKVICSRNLSVKGSDKKYKALFGAYLPLVQAFFKLLGFTTKGDPLAGFRVMRKDVWNVLNLKTNDFLIETEMNLRAIELGLKVGEVPIPSYQEGWCPKKQTCQRV